ncbi:MAG TPA: ChbG/HpnK family deacetylase [Candidatus Sulfotelmatobacter sp.]|nr:ChbG/HpnK family deacetylase [Candidatus Sulfotelmatobacter sp.]
MSGFLVVNADDLGVSRGATLGILEAHRHGIVTSASLAVTTPGYGHALTECVARCPALGVGLHFTLTSGRPVSPCRDVPALVDEAGFLRWRFLPLLAALAVPAPGRPEVLAQIELELEAQIQRVLADGVRPDHIDGERHVHLIPGIFEAVIEAAVRHGIPFVRFGSDIGARLVRPGHVARLIGSGGFAKSWLLTALTKRDRRFAHPAVRTAGRFASYLYSGKPGIILERVLTAGPSDGITEIMVHPGVPEESRDLALGNREIERYLASPDRAAELSACLAARKWATGWRLATFGQLAAEPGAAR